MEKMIQKVIAERRKWLSENGIQDWNDLDTEYVALITSKRLLKSDDIVRKLADYKNLSGAEIAKYFQQAQSYVKQNPK